MSDSIDDVRTVICEWCERAIGYNVATHISKTDVVCEDCAEEIKRDEREVNDKWDLT